MKARICFSVLILLVSVLLKAQTFTLSGTVKSGGKPVPSVTIKLTGSSLAARSDETGKFKLILPLKEVYQVSLSHVSYHGQIKTIKPAGSNSFTLDVILQIKPGMLDTVAVFAVNKPETLVGKPDYSVVDFDFFEDRFLLLCTGKSANEWLVKLSDYEGNISATGVVPLAAGKARNFFHDYEGATDLICDNRTYRVGVLHNQIILETISESDFFRYLYPVSDTAHNAYYIHNHNKNYPSFNHFSISEGDSIASVLRTITNEDLLQLYNLEYYYLPPTQRLQARNLADYYKMDEHVVAALMSGFTKSMYYEPLFAPLFVLNDTVCIFDHYKNHIYRYGTSKQLIDSLTISYHHPKNWRDWKKQLIVDPLSEKVYAGYGRNGRKYLKLIDHRSGAEKLTYVLKNHSADKIKIREGFAYYVYRPFGSTQETFLYREKIE